MNSLRDRYYASPSPQQGTTCFLTRFVRSLKPPIFRTISYSQSIDRRLSSWFWLLNVFRFIRESPYLPVTNTSHLGRLSRRSLRNLGMKDDACIVYLHEAQNYPPSTSGVVKTCPTVINFHFCAGANFQRNSSLHNSYWKILRLRDSRS